MKSEWLDIYEKKETLENVPKYKIGRHRGSKVKYFPEKNTCESFSDFECSKIYNKYKNSKDKLYRLEHLQKCIDFRCIDKGHMFQVQQDMKELNLENSIIDKNIKMKDYIHWLLEVSSKHDFFPINYVISGKVWLVVHQENIDSISYLNLGLTNSYFYLLRQYMPIHKQSSEYEQNLSINDYNEYKKYNQTEQNINIALYWSMLEELYIFLLIQELYTREWSKTKLDFRGQYSTVRNNFDDVSLGGEDYNRIIYNIQKVYNTNDKIFKNLNSILEKEIEHLHDFISDVVLLHINNVIKNLRKSETKSSKSKVFRHKKSKSKKSKDGVEEEDDENKELRNQYKNAGKRFENLVQYKRASFPIDSEHKPVKILYNSLDDFYQVNWGVNFSMPYYLNRGINIYFVPLSSNIWPKSDSL